MERHLQRTITLPQAIALYIGAIIGAGVLSLPGLSARIAGPSAILSWAFVCLLGLPLALTFAALAARFPDAGGVSTFAARAFGPATGAVVGWFYFFTAATGQIIVPLTGAYYAASALHLGREATFLVALALLATSVAANYKGLQLSGRLQLAVSGTVAALLFIASVVALPRVSSTYFHPFFPNGVEATGNATVVIFFAFFGWEVITHLAAEFRDPARDVVRSTSWAAAIVTLLYLGIIFVTVGTHSYGTPEVDRISVAQLVTGSIGSGAGAAVAVLALFVSMGTINAFVAGTSRLGYALGRDGSFPAWMGLLNDRGVPTRSVLAVGFYAGAGLLVAYLFSLHAEHFLFISNSLGIATYIIGTAAGVRLLQTRARLLALISLTLCLMVIPFAGASFLLPVLVSLLCLIYRKVASSFLAAAES